MKKQLITFLMLVSVGLFAQTAPNWLRYPVISPDGSTIVFTYKGDLYKVNSNGGDATQLTFHESHDFMPVFSKDGKTIAFASDRYGNFDVFTMDIRGGEANRITFHSNDEQPFSFSADNKSVLFGALRQDLAEHRQYPHGSQSELYSVPVAGGRVDQVFTFPAEYVQVNKSGNQMVYHDKKGGENEFRKHQTSAIARDIWVYDKKTDSHKMITSYEGEDRQPIYSQDEKSLYFLSEESGNFNVYKLSLDNPSARTQLTNFKTHPVRFLSMGGGTLSFGYDGELYTMKEGQQPKKLSVNIVTQSKANNDKFVSINGGVGEMAISPNGKEIAFTARGEVFVTSVDGSLTKRITNTPEQERFVTFSPDGKSVVYASERDGRWSIFKTTRIRETEEPFFFASTLVKEEPLVQNKLDNYLPNFSPDGKKLAFIEGRRTLKVLDLASNNTTTLMTPDDLYHMGDGDQSFTWSPDSKWILFDWGKTLSNNEILLLAADGSKRVNLTESGYSDSNPKWVNDGKQMIWFSNRDGLKSYATSGSSQRDVYSMFFDQDAWDKYNLSKEDYDLMKEIEKATKKDEPKDKEADTDKKDEKEKEKVKDLTFDWDDMKDRKVRMTIHSSSLGDAVLSKDGDKLYYLARFEKGMNLWSTDLRTRETKMAMKLDAGFGSLTWDKDRKNLYLLSGGRISKIDPESGKREGVDVKGEMNYDAVAERQYMFDHVYIRTKNVFYEPTFHGIDWELMRKEYSKYLPSIGNSYEFSELLSEMLGELNVSHSGARYSTSIPNADATASLGVFMDYKHKGDGVLIAEVIKGGPLDKANLNVTKGMIIEKIDGETISQNVDVAKYLNRKADQFTLLEIYDPATKKRQQITMKPISLGAERGLLYDRWVKINEKEVEEKSKGQLGYVHIPGMSDGPYRDIYEDMMGKFSNRKAVVVDTRFNGGGDLVADLAMFFTGEPFITYATEAKVVGGEPTSRWTKPTLAMFNESMYSDGHCFASGYTDLKIGKTVGMPVPGTCSFAGWEGLPDGGRWGVVPVSAKNKAGEWMENNQTEPQFKVKLMPGVVDKGRDQQLEKAIEELMKEIR
ncbi:C-terminal processing protease CtpA/Prc [Roseivirga ehrenbergii]|uniref:Tricorn protease homolog n=1 Tax=Roseivirga ehrenbergii (strain DSM 102268 / JCM 13514 / KCTC 12282 / NCIMB 14502 / KMM 6017) TaxID=279360 RepID=A0A150WY10_ROSEK|nr:S41 family peptidase [Roseivirga ehrenbergii]KYG71367.1 peptidase S41 [Roseivirga ehrenbergii]TCK99587.1 C-terminal processing protease CtpA/Prc [Roseivirga ehrenbergii]